MQEFVDYWIRAWEYGVWEYREFPTLLLLVVGVGTVLLGLVIGATARTYFNVIVRVLVLFFCSAILGPADHFIQLLLMGNPIAIAETPSCDFLYC